MKNLSELSQGSRLDTSTDTQMTHFDMRQLKMQMARLSKQMSIMQLTHEKQMHSLRQKQKEKEDIMQGEIKELRCSVDECLRQLQLNKDQSRGRKTKHESIGVSADRICHSADRHQIRWILLGFPLNKGCKSRWQITFQVMTWSALGVASRVSLERRNFEGLNGRSDHGCHVMDCYGWTHTNTESIYNYQQMGVHYKAGETIEIQFKGNQIIFNNLNSQQRFVLPVEEDKGQLHVAVAVNKETKCHYRQIE